MSANAEIIRSTEAEMTDASAELPPVVMSWVTAAELEELEVTADPVVAMI